MITKFLNPKNDTAFKRIFGRKHNKSILLALLNSVLKKQIRQPIQEVTLVSPVQDAKTLQSKTSILDVMCRDEEGAQYIVEMQIDCQKSFTKRAVYYASQAYTSQIGKGGRYNNLQKVIFLAFLSESIFKKQDHYKSDHQIRNIVTNTQEIDHLVFTFVELDKFQVPKDQKLSELSIEEKFYLFLKSAESMNDEEIEELVKGTPVIQKAFDELVSAHWSKGELQKYEAQQKILMDYYSSLIEEREEGREEGKKEGKIVIAQEMLARDMDRQLILEITGLSLEEIEKGAWQGICRNR